MRFSRLGVLVLLTLSVFLTANCSYFNRILSRKNLVDGSIAYKERKFQEAEDLFRRAASRDPEGLTMEGRTAQVFLARTLHSQFIGDRRNTAKAEEAISAYQKALDVDKNDQSSYKAIASLYDNLQRPDDWQRWVTERANRADIEPQHRAEALTSLASRKNTCANEVTDTEQTKKTVKKDGKDVFQWVKPENPDDLERLRGCVTDGVKLIDQAIALEPEAVKNAKSLDIKSLTDQQLKENLDLFKVFESARSYKASLDAQAMRLADMEGRTADRDALKQQADAGRARFMELSTVDKAIQDEIDARVAAQEEAANANANANAGK
jgi:tetratricopeptide (TPR) repeat protein